MDSVASTMSTDCTYMYVALRLARICAPFPNPAVGALVVREGQVVALGHHERAGAAHAEAVALAAAGPLARGATLYVSLEPCNHFGRTSPCVDAILRAGVRRVVVGCLDPNPRVCGGGCARLTAHGVAVAFGPWRAEAEALIERWRVSLHLTGLASQKPAL
jgi:diaminohydroxyphosphoribosylaminopyrimidine deaminase/5-amino-6-(5-phosphoribosylamino)uracil reductase